MSDSPTHGRGPADILPLVARVKARLAEAYGARFAGLVLYGSYARGEAGPHSDVDLLVLLDGPVDRWAEIRRFVELVYDLEAETGELISLVAVDRAEANAPDERFLRHALSEGIPA